MDFDDTIQLKGETVYNFMLSIKHGCVFTELQQHLGLVDTDLCFALMYLLKEKRITQARENNVVVYKVGCLDDIVDY